MFSGGSDKRVKSWELEYAEGEGEGEGKGEEKGGGGGAMPGGMRWRRVLGANMMGMGMARRGARRRLRLCVNHVYPFEDDVLCVRAVPERPLLAVALLDSTVRLLHLESSKV